MNQLLGKHLSAGIVYEWQLYPPPADQGLYWNAFSPFLFLCSTRLHQRMISLYVRKCFINIHWPHTPCFPTVYSHPELISHLLREHSRLMKSSCWKRNATEIQILDVIIIFFCASKVVCASVILPSAAEKVVCYVIISVVQVFRFAICFLWAQCCLFIGNKMI